MAAETTTAALFGGSFNPPHVAHVLAVTYVSSVFEVDEVLVVPVYSHAFGKELASFEDRIAMCRLAMGWLPGVAITDIERDLGEPSRTLKTIEALRTERPDRALRLVIGADVLADRDKWYRWDRIEELAPPIVLGRAGVAHPEAPATYLPEVSSTDIRRRVRAGDLDGIAGMVPAKVRGHIVSRGLYVGDRGPEDKP